ncbi:probable glutamate receptor isoform X2 [Panulirus ornatus]|uniref:probable glutamate receptor isoform X2 n=1 Tax=Panulirus ornatus TaxID=150431 RepID=UPI003A8A9588
MSPTTRCLLLSTRTFPEKLKRVYLPLNSQVTLVNFTREGTRATLWQSYQVAFNLKHNIVLHGHWYAITPHHLPDSAGDSADDGEPQSSSSDSEEEEEEKTTGWVKRTMRFGVLVAAMGDPVLRRRDLTGLHLRCTTVHEEPFNILTRRSDGSVSVSGIFGLIFNTVQEATNFTYTCYPVRDNAWGALVGGQWTGIVGEIHRGVADMAVAALDVTQQRSTVVDFLHGLASLRYVVSMRRPSAGDHMWSAFTKGFELHVWVVVIASMLVLMVALYVVSRCSVHETRISFSDAVFVVFGYICGQGMELQFVSTAGRMVVLSTLLLQTLLLAHYTSNLVSTMATRAPAPSLSTLYDVYKDPSLTFGFIRDTSSNEFFKESSVPFHRELLERIKRNNYEALAGSTVEGMERVLSDPSYLFLSSEIAAFHNYGQDCRLYHLPNTYFPSQVSFPVRKNSTFMPIMNKVLMEIWSSGLFSKWWNDHLHNDVSCDESGGMSLDAKVFLIPFLILSSSVLMSSLVYFAELCHIRKDSSSPQCQMSRHARVSTVVNGLSRRVSHMSQGGRTMPHPTP